MVSKPANAMNQSGSAGIANWDGTAVEATESPVTIAHGGTNATSFATTNGIVTYNGTSLITAAGGTINSSGYMKNASQPAFLAYLSASQLSKTGAGTLYTVPFDTVVFDQTSSYNNSTYTYTAPVAGRYLFGCLITFRDMATDMTTIAIEFNHSGAVVYLTNSGFASTNSYTLLATSGCNMFNMALNDTMTVQVVGVGHATNAMGVYGGAGGSYTNFFGYLVC